MIVEKITYNQTEGTYDSAIFTAEKNTDFSKAYRAKKNVQDYVFADGYAKDGQSVERKFAEDMDLARKSAFTPNFRRDSLFRLRSAITRLTGRLLSTKVR